MTRLVFITGNANKARHLERLIGVPIEHHKLDIDEIQSPNQKEVVEHKARLAYDLVKRPVLVDDIAMGFDALDGLPGTFIKFFVDANNGLENLCRMADGLGSRRAIAYGTFGIFDGSEMKILQGSISGYIADRPRGDSEFAYGWDKIFCPDGYNDRTRAELLEAEYDEVYNLIRPIGELRAYLTNK